MKAYLSVCPLDCYDSCSLAVTVEQNKIVKLTGNPEHPVTRGFICKKGQKLLDRQYAVDRITTPLRKTERGWQKLSWEEAYELMAAKLQAALAVDGPKSILHINDCGSGGLLRSADSLFFNCLGGVTLTEGNLCWGAGYEAQRRDFGALFSHSWDDLVNAKTIVLWGRDPANTNLHLVPFLKEAQQAGSTIISISTLRTKSAELSDYHFAPKPGSDGALALGMAHVILANGWFDSGFLAGYVDNFEAYAHLVKEYTPAKVAAITGLTEADIETLARLYGRHKPSAILFGYGLQRYQNGGRTVRAIDALAAITGNIGIKGGGVNYAHQYWKGLLNKLDKAVTATPRLVNYAKLGDEILAAQHPAIKVLFVSRANPVCQLPDTTKVLEAFSQVDFKVALDFFLNDTVEACDLFLPVTTVFESEDLVATSWSEYLSYAPQVVPARGEAKSELEIFNELAQRLELATYPQKTATQWLEHIIEPLAPYEISLDKLKQGPIRHPLVTGVAWEGRLFNTPSGKFQLCAEPWQPPLEVGDQGLAREYPFVLLSPHKLGQMHSQHFNLQETEHEHNLPVVELNPADGEALYVRKYDRVLVENRRGAIEALVNLTTSVPQGVAVIYEGFWNKEAKGVNFLTGQIPSDMGDNASYNDCRCQIRKYMID